MPNSVKINLCNSVNIICVNITICMQQCDIMQGLNSATLCCEMWHMV